MAWESLPLSVMEQAQRAGLKGAEHEIGPRNLRFRAFLDYGSEPPISRAAGVCVRENRRIVRSGGVVIALQRKYPHRHLFEGPTCQKDGVQSPQRCNDRGVLCRGTPRLSIGVIAPAV
jgi:hypothetical protein